MKLKENKKGQVMVLTVMMISGAVLSATAIVGLLTLYQVRHSAGVIDSAKALFAADAGVECALMQHKDAVSRGCSDGQITKLSDNMTQFVIHNITDSATPPNIIGARSVGTYLKTSRSFEAQFNP